MVCRAEIFKFIVNQELCSLFNTLLIVLSHKDSAPFEHALNMFHSSPSLYLTGGRMPTPQPTRWVAQPPLGATWGQERLCPALGLCRALVLTGTGWRWHWEPRWCCWGWRVGAWEVAVTAAGWHCPACLQGPEAGCRDRAGTAMVRAQRDLQQSGHGGHGAGQGTWGTGLGRVELAPRTRLFLQQRQAACCGS